MQIGIYKLPNKLFQVVDIQTGEIHSKGTTISKALKQKKLLEYIDKKKRWSNPLKENVCSYIEQEK
jgi:hypothetical protein